MTVVPYVVGGHGGRPYQATPELGRAQFLPARDRPGSADTSTDPGPTGPQTPAPTSDRSWTASGCVAADFWLRTSARTTTVAAASSAALTVNATLYPCTAPSAIDVGPLAAR